MGTLKLLVLVARIRGVSMCIPVGSTSASELQSDSRTNVVMAYRDTTGRK